MILYNFQSCTSFWRNCGPLYRVASVHSGLLAFICAQLSYGNQVEVWTCTGHTAIPNYYTFTSSLTVGMSCLYWCTAVFSFWQMWCSSLWLNISDLLLPVQRKFPEVLWFAQMQLCTPCVRVLIRQKKLSPGTCSVSLCVLSWILIFNL